MPSSEFIHALSEFIGRLYGLMESLMPSSAFVEDSMDLLMPWCHPVNLLKPVIDLLNLWCPTVHLWQNSMDI